MSNYEIMKKLHEANRIRGNEPLTKNFDDMKPKNNEYPLYPKLTEQGKEEAQKIMDGFKPKLISMVEEVLCDLYTDVSYYIESDHWCNYRNALMDGFKGYRYGKPNHEHDYKELRQAIYNNHKEEIIKDLNADLVEENARLKTQIEQLHNDLSNLR